MSWVSEQSLRELMCEIGRRSWMREFVASNDGNFSLRLDDDRILCTPTFVSKGFMHPNEMAVVDMQGNQLSGPLRATSEIRMHLAAYRHRPDVHAAVHVHPPHATAFAIAHKQLPQCVLAEIELFIGEIPSIPYATPGTDAFAEAIVPYFAKHDAFLLSNHGALTLGTDLLDAYFKMETLEQYCRILSLAAALGGWQQIDAASVKQLLAYREKLGRPDARVVEGRPLCGDNQIPTKPGEETGSMVAEITKRVLQKLQDGSSS